MTDNRTPEEKAADAQYMRTVTEYFTQILGANKTQGEAPVPAPKKAEETARNMDGVGSPHLMGF